MKEERQTEIGCTGASLDLGGCTPLQQILASFTAPISEEQVWAVIHQGLQCLSLLLESLVPGATATMVTSPHHILISRWGLNFKNSFQEKTKKYFVVIVVEL